MTPSSPTSIPKSNNCRPQTPTTPRDVDQDGNHLPKSPEFSASLGAEYRIPLERPGNLALRLEYSYRDRIFYTLFNDPLAASDSHDIVNGRLTLTGRDGKWSAALYARNLLDEKYEVGGFRGGAFGNIGGIGRPRTYGVNLKYNFLTRFHPGNVNAWAVVF